MESFGYIRFSYFLSKTYAISDRRIKKDIVPITTEDAIESEIMEDVCYTFLYGKTGRGVIADEVNQKYVTETN
jgi:hypothetical protein